MKKLKIGVLYGGPSAEREVSLVTGKAVFDNLDRSKYLPSLIEMTKDSRFLLLGKDKRYLDLQNKDRKKYDLIFIALHGTFGEDGCVQGMLEALGIPYTGSNTLASALAMNKVFTGQIYRVNNLPHPEFIHVKSDGWKNYRDLFLREAAKKIGYPAVVKPADQGSAVGVYIVKNEVELVSALNKTFQTFSWMMVQKFIKGQEATCGVLEKNGDIFPLPPTHIKANFGTFYDYKSKYKPGGSTHICPADFPAKVNKEIQTLALKAHKALGCSGMSRTDIFYGDDGKLWVIETNTIPGMTPTSLLPEAAGKAEIPFPEMLDLIIKASLK
ncbi:MAG: D-alanine--D-alanine ligase [Candidatus Magasanikbacteria bacterium]|nr:D-alanine--D-alanine ligase [Candidatus Magasanikbacteria bacterium]